MLTVAYEAHKYFLIYLLVLI